MSSSGDQEDTAYGMEAAVSCSGATAAGGSRTLTASPSTPRSATIRAAPWANSASAVPAGGVSSPRPPQAQRSGRRSNPRAPRRPARAAPDPRHRADRGTPARSGRPGGGRSTSAAKRAAPRLGPASGDIGAQRRQRRPVALDEHAARRPARQRLQPERAGAGERVQHRRALDRARPAQGACSSLSNSACRTRSAVGRVASPGRRQQPRPRQAPAMIRTGHARLRQLLAQHLAAAPRPPRRAAGCRAGTARTPPGSAGSPAGPRCAITLRTSRLRPSRQRHRQPAIIALLRLQRASIGP